MRETQGGKLRSDKPSGRQAAEQPEHSEKKPAASSLHQGQGPDFPSQDSHIQNENPGLTQIRIQPVERKKADHKPQDPPETLSSRQKKNKQKKENSNDE